MYNDGYGGTNLDCTSASDPGCWGHRDNILGNWTTGGGQTAQMGDGDTAAGQYAQIFVDQRNPADSLVDTITPSSLPTTSTPAAPDVVQVLPASSPNTGAGTPVMIEGNYFGTSPQVFFGGVAATNVQVHWNGELTADAPADPAGSATDQVVVTVTTGAGSSSSTGLPQVNEFTYAPTSAPSVTSVSPTSGAAVPSGSVTIHGSNFYDGGVAPIVDFGTVASIGSMTYSSNQITATIPPSINLGTVDITVTTPAGTSAVSAGGPLHLHVGHHHHDNHHHDDDNDGATDDRTGIDCAAAPHAQLLAGRIGRGHLHVRCGPLLRVGRVAPPSATRRRHHADGRSGRVLARGLRRGDLRLR